MRSIFGTRASTVLLSLTLLAGPAARAGDLLVSSRFSNNVLRYDAETGAFIGVFASGNGVANPNGIAYGPDGRLYVGNGDEGRVLRFDGQTGDFIDEFITPATPGGLVGCRAIAFGPDGHLYVNSGGSDQVLRYDGITGDFLGVAAQGNGMDGPVGLAITPDGTLYVGAALSNRVYVFDASGNFVRSVSCGFGFSNATGVLLEPAGTILAAYSVTDNVVRMNPLSGTCQGVAASGGGLDIPIAMIFAPDGHLLVGSFGNDKVIKYNLATGQPIGDFITSGSGGLDGTHNFAFIPDPPPIPAASTWSLIVLALCLGIAGALAGGRRARCRALVH